MGNCLDTCLPRKPDDPRTRPYVQMRQQQTWAKTGIVGLRDQGLKELPAALAESGAALKVIDASNNRLTTLPDFLDSLSGLQRLVLAGNLLTAALPPGAAAGLASLKILVLDDNQVGELPPDIGQLRKLERLSLSGNRLRALPAAIGGLESLQALVVSRNALESLPDELGRCGRLEELDAQGNQLAVIPAALGQLKRLKTLQLDNNRVFAVPSEVLFGCVALQTLSLHGCPIKPDELQETPGFKEFDERRKSKYDKVIAGGALLGNRGLDEGVDRVVSPPRR
ncbi:hypothetical protein PLESTB_000919800 [Pleodorina starrii]|uniref:Disease resistance R13L4/SHOC-2-like LRR domain-containing protein n=1 Tax=Pleodorina starrii TaxID=330485 RepID=A0A9W6F3X9_9CHLO|nr:hypothetical protein PLESTM_001530600 [Pleodorina starrii]GLC54915.1 hypothetical protein PLESTB_000919800 [Pleodorina starrii]GLC73637.1 hypothetical protein PLESTF_001402800 [Pleodorina starrii]